MRRTYIFLAALLLLALIPGAVLFAGGSVADTAPRVPTEAEINSDELARSIDPNLIDANTRFAFELLQELISEDRGKNVFFSPLSILLALAMTYNGAAGDTKLAMAEALEFSQFDLEQLNRGFNDLMVGIVNADQQVEVSIANSIWYRLGYDVKEDFIDRNARYYSAEVRELDFSDPQAADTMNNWIDQATKGKIEKMFDSIPPETKMYLINAIYFKGDWTHQFSESATQDGEFILETGSKKMVPMMHLEENFRHAQAENLGILRLPYGREKLAMYILLPDEGEDLDEITSQLNEVSWNRLRRDLEDKEVTLTMPKYRIEYGVKILNDVLTKMGMGAAFAGGFSGINPKLFISRVMHKAVIDVNEKGSEAAAATVVDMAESIPPEPVEFIVDRPFLFAISDDRTGSILFLGKVAEP